MTLQATRVRPERVVPFRQQRTGVAAWPAALWRFARKKPLGAVAALIVLLVVLMAIFAGQITLHEPLQRLSGMRQAAPGTIAPDGRILLLGGDEIGRDLFSRTVYGSRVALQIGLMAVGVGTLIGTLLGLVSGYWGGWADILIQRVMDSIMAFPGLVLALMLISVYGNGTFQVVLAIGLLMIPYASRLVRGSVLSAKQNQYVEAARCIGARDVRILFRHILPNVTAPIIILAATYFSAAIIAEASLSFLGLGTQPPTPSWGNMIRGPGMGSLLQHPVLLIAPSVALSLTVLGFNLLGDALRDIWDPRLRGSR